MTTPAPLSRTQAFILTALSAVLWYFTFQLNDKFGWMIWLAPLPLLIISFQTKWSHTFLYTFVAYLIGRLSWYPFLSKVLPGIAALIITLLLPLLYSICILLTRWIVLRTKNFASIFAYPVIMSVFEFVSFSNSADGTAGSLVYKQMGYLPVIQVASLTGIWGIVFFISLIPSTLAVSYQLSDTKSQSRWALLFGSLIIFLILGLGWLRLGQIKPSKTISAGLTVVNETKHIISKSPTLADEKKVVNEYVAQIALLAKSGARYVLFPEKVLYIKDGDLDSLLAPFKTAAQENNVSIIGGLLVFKESSKQNIVVLISPDGKVQQYIKRHHVRGWEDGEEVGEHVGWLNNMPVRSAMAICKDMDFPQWLVEYRDADLLFVPAWDFEDDGWLHSRMAMMRGVENGYTIVRAARQGRLTVSDYCGRVLSEQDCDHGNTGSLLAPVPVYTINTLYSRWGNWFAWLCVIVLGGFTLSTAFFKK